MIIFACCVFLLFSFIWPFWGGYREMKVKSDPLPLFINMEYLKEPRYFALSFRKFFADFFTKPDLSSGIYELKLSKTEKIEVFENKIMEENKYFENISYVKSNFVIPDDTVFEKEVYVRGNVNIGKNNELRALACDGEVNITENSRINRWLDAEGKISVGENCDLGISATTDKELVISNGCSFKRLYGFPIITSKLKENHAELLPDFGTYKILPCRDEGRNISEIPPNSHNDFSIITAHSLTIGDNSIILGHIKTYGTLHVGKNVLISGNIFADGNIQVGENSKIFGDIFSQDVVDLAAGVQVGKLGGIKSVIGNRSVVIHAGVVVYGYITTEGTGCVV